VLILDLVMALTERKIIPKTEKIKWSCTKIAAASQATKGILLFASFSE
jgi:hypothetical protein